MTSEPIITTVRPGVARIQWHAAWAHQEFRDAVRHLRQVADEALLTHHRVEAWVGIADVDSQRAATWSGLRREGIARGQESVDGVWVDRVILARVVGDPPASDPVGFRELLNSFLPRKRAIGQMLVTDAEGRVLLCELAYKKDWDLPGGVIEVGESPAAGVTREIREEMAVELPAGPLLLTDWLPVWRGWDDALCLVFDGGVHSPTLIEQVTLDPREIRAIHFCTLDEVRAHATDFTARRVESALAARDDGPAFTESGGRRASETGGSEEG